MTARGKMRSDGGRPPRSRRESGEGHHGDEVVQLSVFAVPRGEIKTRGKSLCRRRQEKGKVNSHEGACQMAILDEYNSILMK